MKQLDLHGKRHEEVDRLVENFILLNDLPLEIITGNSDIMMRIVEEVCDRHNFKYNQHWFTGSGSIVILE